MARPEQDADDGIVLLDDTYTPPVRPGQRAAPAIQEVQIIESPLPESLARKFEALEIKKAPEPEKPLRHLGSQVIYHKDGTFYIKDGSARSHVAYTGYAYLDRLTTDDTPAVGMWMGETPVFCRNARELEIFKKLMERFEFKVQPGSSLFFWSSDADYCYERPTVNGPHGGVNYSRGTLWVHSGETGQMMDRYHDDTPLMPSMEKYFEIISKMIDYKLRATKEELRRAQMSLDNTLANRSEELHDYVISLVPPAERADIHNLLASRLEDEYSRDQAAVVHIRSTITEKMELVKTAKAGLPAGRKGAALKKSYLGAPIIERLCDSLNIWRNGCNAALEIAFKEDLIVEEIFYGRPFLIIDFTIERRNGYQSNSNVRKVRAWSRDVKAFMHPHLRGAENFCIGSFSEPMSQAFMTGNLPMVISLFWEYLNNYNEDSPLVALEGCRTSMMNARPHNLVVRRK